MTAGGHTGVVLSGGGADGAYEVGVLKALLQGASPATGYRPVDPGIYTGTSVGAYNATFLCSRPGRPAADVAAELETVWLDRIANTVWSCGNGVYRLRGAPFQALDPGCLARPVRSLVELGQDVAVLTAFGMVKGAQFLASDAPIKSRLLSLVDLDAFVSPSPFEDLVAQTIDPTLLSRSSKRLVLAASNWKQGVVRLFSRQEIAGAVGPRAILASAALPGIFPPVPIDGIPYVDGGVLLNTPLKPAIDGGADTIHVVFVDPRVDEIALTPLESTLDTFYRMFAIIWASNVRKDVLIASGITRTLELLEREPAGGASREEARSFLQVGQRIYERFAAGGGYRKVNVHVYRPRNALGEGEGILDFRRDRLASVIEMGYQDAVQHDCEASGCGLWGQPAGTARRRVA
ncbi:MAG TPA: patatin-like phospholipase family protein [Thermoanaerobaculia bacterium]